MIYFMGSDQTSAINWITVDPVIIVKLRTNLQRKLSHQHLDCFYFNSIDTEYSLHTSKTLE